MDDFFLSITSVRIFFVLGIVNLVLGSLIFFSCRCIPMTAFVGNRLMKYRFYQRFYRAHCALWPMLWLSIVAHAVLAIGFVGNPF